MNTPSVPLDVRTPYVLSLLVPDYSRLANRTQGERSNLVRPNIRSMYAYGVCTEYVVRYVCYSTCVLRTLYRVRSTEYGLHTKLLMQVQTASSPFFFFFFVNNDRIGNLQLLPCCLCFLITFFSSCTHRTLGFWRKRPAVSEQARSASATASHFRRFSVSGAPSAPIGGIRHRVAQLH